MQRGKVAAVAATGVGLLGLWLGVAALVAQGGGSPGDALRYSRGFLITGDYAVGGVDLREDTHIIENGFSTAPISMNGVPANADILAAYLFWETVTATSDAWQTEAAGVKFRGFDLDVTNVLSVKRTAQPGVSAACFGSGSVSMHMFQGDVLRFLPVKVDSAGKPTGKRLVNSADLAAQGLDPHTVTLPVRDGNGVPESAGASLVVFYRDPDPNAPLKKIVLYTGNTIKPDNTTLGLTIKGIYGSASAKSAKITHIVSSGQPNSRLRFSFAGAGATNSTIIGASPFTDGPASQRWWANPTVDVSALMVPGGNTGAYGETVSTSMFHSSSAGSYDCVALGAVVFSTAIEDVDKDGLPDALENAPIGSPLTDADGRKLPDLHAMGAGDHGKGNKKDIFIEVNAMRADAGTKYGSLTAPYAPGVGNEIKEDPSGHNHLPTPYALKLVGDAFAAHDIRVHFDVGDLARYRTIAAHCIPEEGEESCTPIPGVVQHPDFVDDYRSNEADAYLIATGARGGEIIAETACDPSKPACHFPDYPGTVPWKLGLQAHRDAPVDGSGNELIVTSQGPNAITFANLAGDGVAWTGRRRFDPERRGLFKYLLYAHARGNPKSLPCLVDGQPAPYLEDLFDTPDCGGVENENPTWDPAGYHVPTSASGVAELPGGNFMVTLGLWDAFVGRPFVRASTTFHELGHTLSLFHGGPETERTSASTWQPGAVAWGNPTTATWTEANCKPNYLSSMSYLFQVHGLFDDTDQINLDYSWTKRDGLSETTLFDNALSPAAVLPNRSYQTAWFAPSGSALAIDLGVTAAKRYCNGVRWTTDPLMARVYGDSSTADIDWNGDALKNAATTNPLGYDANFDNVVGALGGFSDWDNIRLNQTGAVATGVTAGSAEGVFFDNSGTANGVFFDNSGVFFDQSGVWFDNSGVWFDNAGGVFFDNSGVFFDNSGVFFDNSGVWFDNAGGVWFDNAGGVFFDNAGGVFFDNAGGVFFDNAGGVFFDNSGQEMTFEQAKSFGRGRPHKAATCVIGRDQLVGALPDTRQCSVPGPNGENNHRAEVLFEQLQVGGIDDYLIERMSTEATQGPDNAFAEAGAVGAYLDRFTDPDELADDVEYRYRVRGRSTDEFGNSGWSRSVTETAVNTPPVAVDDGPYTVASGSTLTVNALLGVLANDTVDVDSPSTSRSVFSATAPIATTTSLPTGTLTMNYANGSFSYAAPLGFAGLVTFTYRADNGPWSGGGSPARRLSPPSNPVTVTISVSNTAPTCTALTASVVVGGSVRLTPSCTDLNGDTLIISSPSVAGGGSVAMTGAGSFTYTAPSTAGTATVNYNVSDGVNAAFIGTATITVNPIPPYDFVNVQNLPPPANKTFKTGSTVPMKWQWTRGGVAANTANQAIVRAYACSTTLPPGSVIGVDFTPAQPGSGNSFSYTTSNNTWTFNLKLWYSKAGVLTNLPIGTYVVQVRNSITQQVDPDPGPGNNVCGTAGIIRGALISVVR